MNGQTYESIGAISNVSMCKKNRAFQYETKKSEHPTHYVRSAIIRSTIAAALTYHVKNKDEIMEYMKSRYDECGYHNYQQKMSQLGWDHHLVMRYLNDEIRTPIFPKPALVTLDKKTLWVCPDFAFVSPNDPTEVEIGTFNIGKPNVTSRGNKNAIIRDLRLYAMILYARNAGFKKITASFYFLKKNSDSKNWAACEQSFFGGGGNIVSMIDLYDGQPNNLDDQMKEYLNILDNGMEPESICQEDCEHCSKYDLCKYLMPPISITKDPVVRSASDIHLTPNQLSAIQYMKGVVRINAGAGAGKTMVVALRIKYLIEHGVSPDEICCVTFTNAGAKEMLHRAELYAGCDLSEMTICTFNSFQNDIVKDCWQLLNYAREPKVIDEIEKYAIISNILTKYPIFEWSGRSFLNFTNTTSYGARGALKVASDTFLAIKQLNKPLADITTSEIRNMTNLTYDEINDAALYKLIQLYDLYDHELKSKGLIEFEDQEILTFKILEMNPNYLEAHYRFKHIIIDEFQDSTKEQIDFIQYLRAMPTFESLMVVGDDSQSIFGFRNTSPEFIIHFEDYIGTHVDDIFLLENHRSTPPIINFANYINSLNVDRVNKDLIATRTGGKGVVVEGFYDKTSEYQYIISGIKKHLMDGWKPEDIAVIAYTKNELKQIADLLTKKQIPSMFGAPEPLLENSRIRAILAFAKVITDRTDSNHALVVANALDGGNLMTYQKETIDHKVAAVIQRAEAIRAIPNLTGKKMLFLQLIDDLAFADETVLNFKDGLMNKEFDEIMAYCSDFELFGSTASYRRINEYPGVVLITAHSSKGLEYKVVYNTISKYQTSTLKNRTVEEEIRRLLFVSATRARDELYITGQYLASGNKSSYSSGSYITNRFLQDSFHAIQKDYNPCFV